MFESQTNTVNIKDFKVEILQIIIDFSYSGEILLNQVATIPITRHYFKSF